jgi:hypothetical protein
VAIANLSTSPAIVSFEQTDLDGSHVASTTLTVPGSGQVAAFLGDISQQAIEQWRFCPGTQNGTAIATTITITVSFSIL